MIDLPIGPGSRLDQITLIVVAAIVAVIVITVLIKVLAPVWKFVKDYGLLLLVVGLVALAIYSQSQPPTPP